MCFIVPLWVPTVELKTSVVAQSIFNKNSRSCFFSIPFTNQSTFSKWKTYICVQYKATYSPLVLIKNRFANNFFSPAISFFSSTTSSDIHPIRSFNQPSMHFHFKFSSVFVVIQHLVAPSVTLANEQNDAYLVSILKQQP